jgi:hypothetical protein
LTSLAMKEAFFQMFIQPRAGLVGRYLIKKGILEHFRFK